MHIYRSATVAFLNPVGNSKRDSHPNYKHKEGLNKVPEIEAMPFMMTQLRSNEPGKAGINLAYMAVKPCGFANKKKHSKSTEKVN
jgi:hypothetical protein